MKKAVVFGGGLVGYLEACYLVKDGFTVDVYEKYSDPRVQKPSCFRSINLTLGHRGESALREVGLLKGVLDDSVPARGRTAWSSDGSILGQVEYGEKGESIHSISRFDANLYLLNAAEKLDGVKVHFGYELVSCDFEEGTATLLYNNDENDDDRNDDNNNNGKEDEEKENATKREIKVSADLFIGADGAHSAMRAEMCKHKKLESIDFKYHQHYYLEMMIPPKNNEYQLDKTRLHVWPKDSFVLILLPNLDKSFSGTLVMPKSKFDHMLSSEQALLQFFREEFNKVYELAGEENLIEQFMPGQANARTPCRLVSLKCQPYHASSMTGSTKFLLLGDAAHAMVPFYGQGMNTGFEDVQKFHHTLQKYGTSAGGISRAIEEFSLDRCKDGQAMSDISYDHYQSLCSSVKKRNYNLRRHVDSVLHRIFPDKWIPEYTLVAFSKTPQSQCRAICKSQDKIMEKAMYALFVGALALVSTPLAFMLPAILN